MTREQAKEILPIIEAFSKGKTVERFNPGNGEWDELKNPSFDLDNSFYRIKREPKYRPFKNHEECWQEMHKHPDFGWVKNKQNNSYCKISRIARYYTEERILCVGCSYTLAIAFDSFIFTDGTPFGIQED